MPTSHRKCLECGDLTSLGDYCARHRPAGRDAYRDPEYRRMQAVARAARGKRCPSCGKAMVGVRAPTVGHVVAARVYQKDPNARGNLRVICRRCNQNERTPGAGRRG